MCSLLQWELQPDLTAETVTLTGVRPQILPSCLSLQIATAGTKDSSCPHPHGLFDPVLTCASRLGQFSCEQDMQPIVCMLGELGLLGVLSPWQQHRQLYLSGLEELQWQ